MIDEKFQRAEAELKHHDIEIQREGLQFENIEMFESCQQARGNKAEHDNRSEVAGEGVALAGVGAEIDEVIPKKEECRAYSHAACRNQKRRPIRMVLSQVFERCRDQQIVHACACEEPHDTMDHGLSLCGRFAVVFVFHRAGHSALLTACQLLAEHLPQLPCARRCA